MKNLIGLLFFALFSLPNLMSAECDQMSDPIICNGSQVVETQSTSYYKNGQRHVTLYVTVRSVQTGLVIEEFTHHKSYSQQPGFSYDDCFIFSGPVGTCDEVFDYHCTVVVHGQVIDDDGNVTPTPQIPTPTDPDRSTANQ